MSDFKSSSNIEGTYEKLAKKLCKIPRRFMLGIGPGTGDSAVEFNSTLDLVQGKALSNLIRHWTR